MWSPWKWVKMMRVTRAGSSPAAAMLAGINPAVAGWPPVPLSNMVNPAGVSRKVTM